MTEQVPKIAIYLDFENLAISAKEVYPSTPRPLRIDDILDYAKGYGDVLIKKAFADWNKPPCNQYVEDLRLRAFDLVFLPQTSLSGKNGADLRMTIDALEDMYDKSLLDVFFLGTGDTDFIHLIRKIKERGKEVVVLGFEHSIGRTIRYNCDRFESLEDLLGKAPAPAEKEKKEEEELEDDPRDLFLRYIKNRSTDEPAILSQIKNDLMRLDPSFSEKKYGYKHFKEFLDSFKGDLFTSIKMDDKAGHHLVFFKSYSELTSDINEAQVRDFIEKDMRFIKDHNLRRALYKEIVGLFHADGETAINQMIDDLWSLFDKKVPKATLKRFLRTMAEGRMFKFASVKYTGNIYTMPQVLKADLPSMEKLDDIYLQRIIDLTLKKHPGVSQESVTKMMGLS
ncbi:MAG TPA: NYN domain-containing protein [Methanomassiliicoccales archaeon]|nr:NYN domain-containing protein [Methanomassiliicoccales archaeon]HQQ25096.1 NYN domain-containing protein [Methanomassiliicoccales archaeon]